MKNYAKREVEEFKNPIRLAFYWFVTRIVYMLRLKVVYRLEVNGKENIPKNNKYIVAPNHLSTLDPPLMGAVLPHQISFMSKEELFNNIIMRYWLDWLGAFAVNREHLSPSTIKTAKNISKTDTWVLGLFPQGTREKPGKITKINKGFATMARVTKCDILPIGIIEAHEAKHIPFTGKIIVNIGEVIPYSDNVEEMQNQWIESIQKLTGFKYEEE